MRRGRKGGVESRDARNLFFLFFAHIQIFMFFYKCVCRIFFCVCGSLNEGLFVICKSSGHFFGLGKRERRRRRRRSWLK